MLQIAPKVRRQDRLLSGAVQFRKLSSVGTASGGKPLSEAKQACSEAMPFTPLLQSTHASYALAWSAELKRCSSPPQNNPAGSASRSQL